MSDINGYGFAQFLPAFGEYLSNIPQKWIGNSEWPEKLNVTYWFWAGHQS